MSVPHLLIVDDEAEFCSDLALVLESRFKVGAAHNGLEAIEYLKGRRPDVVLLDVNLGPQSMSGLEILEEIEACENPPPVVMLSGDQDLETVVRAIKMGAFHYAAKSADLPQLMNLLDKALASRTSRLAVQARREEVERLTGSFVATAPSSLRMLENVEQVAKTDATVLITGESGTGKEMVAQRIHNRSTLTGAFVGINCGAVPADIIESELFGHGRGAFTGAQQARVGKFELASGGTLFLDEIGDSPLEFQVKLFRVLEEKAFSRVGQNDEISTSCRILAATSKDLEQAIARGEFRSELFYRLNIYRIHLLPLRERPEEILPLADFFLGQAALRYHKEIKGFTATAQQLLMAHSWPGNARQLRNEVERAVLNCRGSMITLGDIFQSGAENTPVRQGNETYDEAKIRITTQWQESFFRERLTQNGGNITQTARDCGLSRQHLQRILKNLGLATKDFRQ